MAEGERGGGMYDLAGIGTRSEVRHHRRHNRRDQVATGEVGSAWRAPDFNASTGTELMVYVPEHSVAGGTALVCGCSDQLLQRSSRP